MEELEERAAMHAEAMPVSEQIAIEEVEHGAAGDGLADQRIDATTARQRTGEQPQVRQNAQTERLHQDAGSYRLGLVGFFVKRDGVASIGEKQRGRRARK